MSAINREDAIAKIKGVPYVQEHPNIGLLLEEWLKSLPDADDGWIPVEEKLPEKNGFYLVTLNNSCTDFCLWEDKKGFGMLGTRWYPCEEVTAWRELPKPYKPKEDK